MNRHTYFVLLIAFTFHATHAMENPSDMNIDSRVPSLVSLCKEKVLAGYGNTYIKQCQSVAASVKIISDNMDDTFAQEFQASFFAKYYALLPLAAKPILQTDKTGRRILLAYKNKLIVQGVHWGPTTTEMKLEPTDVDVWKFRDLSAGTISNNGQRFYVTGCTGNGTINCAIWTYDLLKGGVPITQDRRGMIIDGLAENKNGDLCTVDMCNNIGIWDVSVGKEKQKMTCRYSGARTPHLLAGKDMIFAGGRLTGDAMNGCIMLYDVREKGCINCMSPDPGAITTLAKSKNDMHFYSSSMNMIVRLWDMRNMTRSVQKISDYASVYDVQENHDGTLVFTCNGIGIRVWNLAAGEPYCVNKSLNRIKARKIAQDPETLRLFVMTDDNVAEIEPNCTFDEAYDTVNKCAQEEERRMARQAENS